MNIVTANYVITRQIQNSNIPFKYQVVSNSARVKQFPPTVFLRADFTDLTSLSHHPPHQGELGAMNRKRAKLTKDIVRSRHKSLGVIRIDHLGQTSARAELETTLHEIEACINSRPLTFVSDDPDQEKPLTPYCAVQHAPNNQVQRRQACEMIRDVDEVFKIYTVHQLCLTGRSQADNSRHSK